MNSKDLLEAIKRNKQSGNPTKASTAHSAGGSIDEKTDTSSVSSGSLIASMSLRKRCVMGVEAKKTRRRCSGDTRQK